MRFVSNSIPSWREVLFMMLIWPIAVVIVGIYLILTLPIHLIIYFKNKFERKGFFNETKYS